MFNLLLSIFSPCAFLYMIHLQRNQLRLTQKLQTETSQLTEFISHEETLTSLSSNILPFSPRHQKCKAVHIDVENIRRTAIELNVWVDYRKLLNHLKKDGSELDVTFYSTTHHRIQRFNASMRRMGHDVIEQPVIIDEESGQVSNTNIDPLMVDGLINESPPSKFSSVVIISGDHRFAECANLIIFRGQSSEFISFDTNTAVEIKALAESHDYISYCPITSISEVIRPKE